MESWCEQNPKNPGPRRKLSWWDNGWFWEVPDFSKGTRNWRSIYSSNTRGSQTLVVTQGACGKCWSQSLTPRYFDSVSLQCGPGSSMVTKLLCDVDAKSLWTHHQCSILSPWWMWMAGCKDLQTRKLRPREVIFSWPLRPSGRARPPTSSPDSQHGAFLHSQWGPSIPRPSPHQFAFWVGAQDASSLMRLSNYNLRGPKPSARLVSARLNLRSPQAFQHPH